MDDPTDDEIPEILGSLLEGDLMRGECPKHAYRCPERQMK